MFLDDATLKKQAEIFNRMISAKEVGAKRIYQLEAPCLLSAFNFKTSRISFFLAKNGMAQP